MFKNREKTFLTFDDANPSMPRVTSNSLAAKFEPTTEMEKEIDVVLYGTTYLPCRFSKRVI